MWKLSGNIADIKQLSKYDISYHIMSQLRRRSLDSKLNTIRTSRKESESEALGDRK